MPGAVRIIAAVRYWLLSLVLPVAAFACADTLDGDGDDGSGAGATNVGGEDAVACGGKECGTPCSTCDQEPCNQVCDGNGECKGAFDVTCNLYCPNPNTPEYPSTGEPCMEGAICEYNTGYGDVAGFPDCRRLWSCTVDGWQSDSSSSCYWDADATCPMALPEEAAECDAANYTDMCGYGDGVFCTCTPCLDNYPNCMGTPRWHCVGLPPDPCPPYAPFIGFGCGPDVPEGTQCDYGDCIFEVSPDDGSELISASRICLGGAWNDVPMDCATPQ